MALLQFDLSVFGQDEVEQVDLAVISDRFGAMALASDRYMTWAQLARMNKHLVDAGLGQLAEKLRDGGALYAIGRQHKRQGGESADEDEAADIRRQAAGLVFFGHGGS